MSEPLPTEARPRKRRGSGKLRESSTPFGETLRLLRRNSGLTLKQLGERAEMSASALSKIESGAISPTYEKIIVLANALGIDVAEFFGQTHQPMATGRRSVCRRGDRNVLTTEFYSYEMLCSELTGKKFVPIMAKIRAHDISRFPDLIRHDGEEFVFVIDGSITIYSEFYEPLRLNVGDSCYYDSRMGHALISSGAEDAQILWVCSKISPME